MSVLVVDKPVGLSSYDVVRRVQRALFRLYGCKHPRALKVGHGGTLDPMASGVLPICIGEGTKVAAFLLDADKAYDAEIRFGVETDTLDATGTVVAEAPVADLRRADVEAALAGFRGVIEQVPPMHSALKHEGRPLYSYARQGQEIARVARRLTIHELELTGWTDPATAAVRVRCSKGTYVRVLAADLGRALGTGAHLTGLRRTVSGPFRLAEAISLADLEHEAAAGRFSRHVSLAEALVHILAVTPDAASALAIWQGKPVPLEAVGLPFDASGQFRVLRPNGSLLSVAEVREGSLRSLRGFHEEPDEPNEFMPGRAGSGGVASVVSSEMGPDPQLSGTLGLTSTRLL